MSRAACVFSVRRAQPSSGTSSGRTQRYMRHSTLPRRRWRRRQSAATVACRRCRRWQGQRRRRRAPVEAGGEGGSEGGQRGQHCAAGGPTCLHAPARGAVGAHTNGLDVSRDSPHIDGSSLNVRGAEHPHVPRYAGDASLSAKRDLPHRTAQHVSFQVGATSHERRSKRIQPCAPSEIHDDP